jgi:hypothetical protein
MYYATATSSVRAGGLRLVPDQQRSDDGREKGEHQDRSANEHAGSVASRPGARVRVPAGELLHGVAVRRQPTGGKRSPISRMWPWA